MSINIFFKGSLLIIKNQHCPCKFERMVPRGPYCIDICYRLGCNQNLLAIQTYNIYIHSQPFIYIHVWRG